MEIKLLKKGYKNDEKFYEHFLEGRILDNPEYFSDETVFIKEAPDFPVYLSDKNEERRYKKFKDACEIIKEYYLDEDREIHMDELFWHSLLCAYKSEYLLSEYPQLKEGHSQFKNIVIKKFDWENYIYKCVIASQYIIDNTEYKEDRDHYLRLIVENLDVYNYIIKYEIFRNDKFLMNVLDIVYENDLSQILKAKIKDRPDLGKDERYGRRVIFEFNKSYPVVLAPTLDKKELEVLFMENLKKYYCLK
ncbi:DUF6339 family protein [Oceanirhabdus sp. W0125-5]|uniref:DUF6339 family protein n=1 Tax=Oceanirhabdus sp. W0125-5 TaxID=2999116 RepID=UPI0022F3033D|nr:DUF6339 family protein [Oceanirhabdus sp. W0125-5]WBW96241.1 DUF6339 family protein [Oceanirhabdus sp. W0125-5]